MSTTFKPLLPAGSSTFTITLTSLASSSTFLAGRESMALSNISNLYGNLRVGGKITVGTSPTAGTFIQVWGHEPASDDLSSTLVYVDTITGADANATITSAEIRDSALTMLAALYVNSTTSSRPYWMRNVPIAALFGGMPTRLGLWVTQNTGASLHATGSNHVLYYTPVQDQGV